MNATTTTRELGYSRRRDSVLAYFGVDPHDRGQRAAFYGRLLGRLAITGAFLVGAAGYVKGIGVFL